MQRSAKFIILTIFCFAFHQWANAQSSDELFVRAKALAFDEKKYEEAIALSKKALQQSPDYADIRTFLGRIYTWTKKTDSARIEFQQIIKTQPKYEDAYIAYGNLEYWNDDTKKGLDIVNQGLANIPDSEQLQLLKAKFLADLRDWQAAETIINQVIAKNPKQTEARALSNKIRENSAQNRIGVNYDFIHFDKQFDDPWHLLSIDYGRQTAIGSIIGRVNYANRFNSNGLQVEADAYPRLSNTFQAYVNAGYSGDVGVFPKFRAGFSLYASLPKSFEAELGFRFLRFSDNTWIYTASVGKYYKNFWFNLRTYVSPSTHAFSQSFAFTTRYYFGGADDFFSVAVNSGLSPDEQQNNILLQDGSYKLKSKGITLGYRKSFKTFNVLTLSAALDNQEYIKDTKGNRFNLGIGYIRRF